MKTRKKQIFNIPPTLLPRLSDSQKSAIKALSVTNLRPTTDGRFRAVGAPLCFGALKGLTPIGKVGNSILAASGTAIYSSDADIPSLPAEKLDATLPGKLICALERDADSLLAMTDGGAALIESKDLTVTCSKADIDYPPLTILASQADAVSTTIAERKLSRVYSGGERMTVNDADALTSDLVTAYKELNGRASAAGWMIQPALMRYKLYDKDGRILFSSAPILLSHPSGLQCADAVELYSDDRQTIKSYNLSAQTWRPVIRLPAVDDDCGVAMAKVFMSPLCHPYHPDRDNDINVNRAVDSDSAFAFIHLPGAKAMKSLWSRWVMKAIARLDALETPVITISAPFASDARSISALIDSNIDVDASARAFSAALSKQVAPLSLSRSLMQRPHHFTAACCAADASVVAWGGIEVRRFSGYKPSIFATEVDSSAGWSATAVVRFAGRRGVIVQQSGIADAPTSFSPLLSYPAPDAESITIICRVGGVTRSATYPLSPDESGRFSVYIAESAVPLTLTPTTDASIPSLTHPVDKFDGYVAFAAADAPLDILNASFLGNGSVTTLLHRRAGDRSWEFGRSRFLAGSDEGLFSIVVGAAAASVSVRKIAPGCVPAPDSLSNGPDGIAFALCNRGSSEGPDLLKIDGSGSVSIFEQSRNYTSVVYNDNAGELWAIRSDGSADIFCRDYCWQRYSRTNTPVLSGLVLRGEPFAIGSKGLLRLCAETSVASVAVKLTYMLTPANLAYILPVNFVAALSVGQILGTLSLSGCSIAGTDLWRIFKADLGGLCLSPFRIPVVSRQLRCCQVDFDANVDGDFIFDSFRIEFYD